MVLAAPQQVALTGHEIIYDRTSKNITASGNVRASFKNYHLDTHNINYNFTQTHINVPNPYTLRSGKNYIKGDNLKYRLDTRFGEANNIHIQIGTLFITGQKLTVNNTKIVVKNATFTSCDLPSPHYKIKAKKMIIYPLFGIFVAFENSLQIKNKTVFWFPTYIYGSKHYSLLSQRTPLPDMGTNSIEGWFVKYDISYFTSQKSTGVLKLGWTEKLGFTPGLRHLFTPNNKTDIVTDFTYEGNDGTSGGLTYNLNLNPKKKTPNTIFKTLFSNFDSETNKAKSDLSVDLSFNKLINNSRLSSFPSIKWTGKNINLPYKVKINTTLAAAYLKEKTTTAKTNSRRFQIDTQFSKTYVISNTLSISPQWINLGRKYNTTYWNRSFGKLALKWFTTPFSPQITYTKQLLNRGDTVFEYEKIYAIQTDELGLNLQHNLKKLRFELDINYNAENWTPRKIDLITHFLLHKVKASINWKTVEKQFLIGFSVL